MMVKTLRRPFCIQILKLKTTQGLVKYPEEETPRSTVYTCVHPTLGILKSIGDSNNCTINLYFGEIYASALYSVRYKFN